MVLLQNALGFSAKIELNLFRYQRQFLFWKEGQPWENQDGRLLLLFGERKSVYHGAQPHHVPFPTWLSQLSVGLRQAITLSIFVLFHLKRGQWKGGDLQLGWCKQLASPVKYVPLLLRMLSTWGNTKPKLKLENVPSPSPDPMSCS